ncbi:MAG: hypothetical protein JJU11_08795, partial [Candidatus Sumerlaeia bacterium]|nr:hypothetical protein [Candidatus Sumerlaeia bacterium]
MRIHEIIILLLLGTALLFGLGYEGFASHGLPRAVAYLLVATAAAVALVFSTKHMNLPQKWMALFFLAPILAGGALMIPLPVDFVTSVSRHWADWVTAREATGLPPVTSIPLTLDFEAGTRAINLWIAAGAMFLASVAVCRSRV